MHRHHEFWWKFLPHKSLTQIYLSLALRTFAISLIGIFVPLYLFHELGYSLIETLSFAIFYSVMLAITSPLAAKFCARYGVKHSILFSMPFYIIYILLLALLRLFSIPLLVLGAFAGFALAFYWMGMHLLFYHASHRARRGEEIGKRRFFRVLGASAGPLVGGLIITHFGFSAVFFLAGVLLFLSAAVLFITRENHISYKFKVLSLMGKDHWKNALYFVSRGSQVIAEGFIWPLFIFVILDDYFSLGIVGAIISGVGALLSVFTGKLSDRIGKRKIIRWATISDSAAWVLRSLVQTTTHIFGATILGAVTNSFRTSPLDALQYDKVSRDVVGYFVSREIFISLGRILMVAVVILLDSLSSGLVYQGLVGLLALLF